jgi:NADPH:quinone reductase-like Zn-dependent oxidoreductase
MVRALGADRVLDYTRESVADLDDRFDSIFGVNGYQPLATYRALLAPGGTYVMIGGETRQIFEALLGRLGDCDVELRRGCPGRCT